jgi:hypothetical protein
LGYILGDFLQTYLVTLFPSHKLLIKNNFWNEIDFIIGFHGWNVKQWMMHTLITKLLPTNLYALDKNA